MKAVALSCPQCGGSQDISDDQNLVECRYCRTRLRVERSATGELEQLLIENELLEVELAIHRLDKEWEMRRKQLLVRTRRGLREHSRTLGFVLLFLGCSAALLNLLMLLAAGFPGSWQAILFFFAVVLTLGGFRERAAHAKFEGERSAYQKRRFALINRFTELDRAADRQRRYEDTTSRRTRLKSLPYPAADA